MRPVSLCLRAEDQAVQPLPAPRPLPPPSSGVEGGFWSLEGWAEGPTSAPTVLPLPAPPASVSPLPNERGGEGCTQNEGCT